MLTCSRPARSATPMQARDGMRVESQAAEAAEQQLPGSKEGAWKWEVRKRMWDYMEANDIARWAPVALACGGAGVGVRP
jgi:hypothetical protein